MGQAQGVSETGPSRRPKHTSASSSPPARSSSRAFRRLRPERTAPLVSPSRSAPGRVGTTYNVRQCIMHDCHAANTIQLTRCSMHHARLKVHSVPDTRCPLTQQPFRRHRGALCTCPPMRSSPSTTVWELASAVSTSPLTILSGWSSTCAVAQSRCRRGRGGPSRAVDLAGVGPSPVHMRQGWGPVPVQTWQGYPRVRCNRLLDRQDVRQNVVLDLNEPAPPPSELPS